MRRQTRSIFVLLLALAPLAPSAIAQAAGEPRLWLSVESLNLAVGQEATVDVMVKDVPAIYGADVRLVFDPAMLQVSDADESQAGVQLEPGDFFDFERAFVLQHQVDNQSGSIDYALALLNPAPPVQGGGRLARITFRAQVDGQTTIHVAEAQFGTQTGETIVPLVEHAELSIATTVGEGHPTPQEAVERDSTIVEPPTAPDETGDHTTAVRESNDDAGFSLDPIVLGFGGGLALAGLVVVGLICGRFWFRRIQQS
jgi:hypothetical protein